MDSLVQPDDHSVLNVAAIHFTPGARTAWHPYDGGQTLYVIECEGRVQSRGEPIATIRPGCSAPTRRQISARARSVSTACGAIPSVSSHDVETSQAGSGQGHMRLRHTAMPP